MSATAGPMNEAQWHVYHDDGSAIVALRVHCPECDAVLRYTLRRSPADNPRSHPFACPLCATSLRFTLRLEWSPELMPEGIDRAEFV